MSANRLQASLLPVLQERRAFGRRRVVWHAWIIPSTLQRLACCVRNVSDGGALLELNVPEWLPATFDVFVEGPDMRLRCELTHRGKHGVGVAFSDAGLAQELMDYCNVPSINADRSTGHNGIRLAPPRLTSEMIRNALHRPK